MSVSSIPFQLRRGGLPFCSSELVVPSDIAQYDYVDLTAVGGDGGYAEAVRVFWLLESLVFSPSGTATSVTTPFPTNTFTKTFSYPTPAATDLSSFSISGVMVDTPVTPVTRQPALRVCSSDAQMLYPGSIITYVVSGQIQYSLVSFLLLYVSSSWRLYYRFTFGFDTSFFAAITNPANVPYPVSSTGTMSVAGYTLNWTGSNSAAWTFTGAGLTASTTFWSF